jgi:hypothetical protein
METARQAADDKHGRAVQARAFAKWTAECVKHGEQLSLMQSFRDVHLEGPCNWRCLCACIPVTKLNPRRQSLLRPSPQDAAPMGRS